MAVREEDDGEGGAGRWGCYAELEIDGTVSRGENDGTEGNDWFWGVDGNLGRGADASVIVGMHCNWFCSIVRNERKVDCSERTESGKDKRRKRGVTGGIYK